MRAKIRWKGVAAAPAPGKVSGGRALWRIRPIVRGYCFHGEGEQTEASNDRGSFNSRKREGAMSKTIRARWAACAALSVVLATGAVSYAQGPRQSLPAGQGTGGWRRPERSGRRVGKASGRPRDGTAGVGARRRRRREHLGLHPVRRDEPGAGRAGRPVRPRLHAHRRQAQAARHDLQVRLQGQRRQKLRRADVHLAARAAYRPRGQCVGDRRGCRGRRRNEQPRQG